MRLFYLFMVTFILHAPAAYAESTVPAPAPIHAMAMHGTPKYGPGQSYDYVNKDAPKGGVFRNSAIGTFDSLNPYIVKGVPATGSGLVYESLLEQSLDEPFTMYGLLAESMEVPADRSWVIFNINPAAKWQDGQPLTGEDVKWSFDALIKKGKPFFKAYYGNVKSIDLLSPLKVRFNFDTANNLELPLIIGQMPIFPKHYWEAEGRDFSQTTLTPYPGSGPYKFGTIKAGRSVSYTRDANWWGKDLPRNKGRYNFDTIVYEYYRDGNIALEAFLGNNYDFRLENTAKLWATSYESPAIKDGRLIKEEIKNQLPQGMQAFTYNIRRDVFKDKKVREALAYAFDFEWSNKQFAYDSYKRTRSYFSNSEMESTGVPQGRELEILEPFRADLPPEVFTKEYQPPKTDGSGNNRENLRIAQQMLDAAGYKLGKDGVRVHETSGVRLEFEFLESNPAFERWVLPFIKNLERIGVKATFRIVDPAQYQKRMTDYDFDISVLSYPQSSSPGNEQREFWGSDKVNVPGSRNYIGLQDKVVDALVEQIIAAPTREELILRCRALDRVLQWGYYVIPNWHMAAWRVAYWNKLHRPDITPLYDVAEESTWWVGK